MVVCMYVFLLLWLVHNFVQNEMVYDKTNLEYNEKEIINHV